MRNSIGIIVVIGAGIAAAMPWIVKDQLYNDGIDTPPAAKSDSHFSLTTFISDTFARTTGGNIDSTRAKAAAARVRPTLEAALTQDGLTFGAPIFLRIFKEENQLELWIKREAPTEDQDPWALFKTYEICTWSGKLGPKLKEGDRQAPEGFYYVARGRMNPQSRFHLSFDLGYPNEYDRAHNRTGSYLMVHGNCVSIGCYAMTDERIEEIYTLADAALANGQKFFRVHAFPFRMTDERMDQEFNAGAKWIDFWKNLKEGYDYFEMAGTPPDVGVEGKAYVFR